MRRAYICSPLSGNISGNIENAKRYARYIFKCGMAPVIPHFYALILDDAIPDERKLGMQADLSLLWVCDEVWVFGDEITEGMKKGNYLCREAQYQGEIYIGKGFEENGGYLNESKK